MVSDSELYSCSALGSLHKSHLTWINVYGNATTTTCFVAQCGSVFIPKVRERQFGIFHLHLHLHLHPFLYISSCCAELLNV